MGTKTTKIIAIIIGSVVGVAITCVIVYSLLFASAFGAFEKDYSVTELKQEFDKNKREVYTLKTYFNSIVPKNYFVEIEFDNSRTLSRFGFSPLDDKGNRLGTGFLAWNVKINTAYTDSIVKPLGWARDTFEALKEKLDKAHCIGIESGEPIKIHFQRYGMGMYSFNVFDKPVSADSRNIYNNSCTYILVNDHLALEYGGGAIGSQCFYNME